MRVTEEAEDIDTETQNFDREAMAKSDGGDGEPLFGEESSDDESRYEKLRYSIHISGLFKISLKYFRAILITF